MKRISVVFLSVLLWILPVTSIWINNVSTNGVAQAGSTYRYTMNVGDRKYLYTNSSYAVQSAFWSSSHPYDVQIVSSNIASCQIEIKNYVSSTVIVQCKYYYQRLVGRYIYTFSDYTDYYITIRDNRVTVTLNANGGSVSPSKLTVSSSGDYGSLPKPSRTGYYFTGWYTSGGNRVYSYDPVVYSSNHTLTARWDNNEYSLLFDGNGADEGSVSSLECMYDRSYTMPDNEFKRTGYIFKGWCRNKDGTGAVYYEGESFRNITSTDGASITFYALWDPDKHTPVVDAAKAPTCTADGKTEGSHCSVCGKVLAAQEVVPATGHTNEVVPGKAATCVDTGLTDGAKCSVCGETITAQTEIPALGHTDEAIPGKAATCTETGLTDGAKCSVCGETITAQTEIPALGHTNEAIPGKAATCTETGLTDGVKCSVCGEILSAQEEIPATGHDEGEWIVVTEATAETEGLKELRCTVCGHVLETKVIPVVSARIPGDVDGNGKVTLADLLLLAKHFAKYDVQINEANANVNGDGKVSLADLLRLAQYFAKYDVVLE